MTNLSLIHRQRRVSVHILTIALFVLLTAFVAPAWSGQTYHNIPGTACAAYNNYQANALQRSHVRLYNPPTNPQSLWVICPIERVLEDIESTPLLVGGYVNAYFSLQSSPSAEVLCIIRDFDNGTIHEPGGVMSGVVNNETIILERPATVPEVSSTPWQFTSDYTSEANYWTVTCKLPPGTGINSVDVYQQ